MRKHTPVAQQRRLVAAYRRSGLSQSAFARANGLPLSTFSSWIDRHPPEEAALVAAFVDVTPAPEPPPFSVEICGASRRSVALTFDAPPPASWFAAVLREVTSC